MKEVRRPDESARTRERRRFLGLLGSAGVVGLILPLRQNREQTQVLSLTEADFYRDHDLAG